MRSGGFWGVSYYNFKKKPSRTIQIYRGLGGALAATVAIPAPVRTGPGILGILSTFKIKISLLTDFRCILWGRKEGDNIGGPNSI